MVLKLVKKDRDEASFLRLVNWQDQDLAIQLANPLSSPCITRSSYKPTAEQDGLTYWPTQKKGMDWLANPAQKKKQIVFYLNWIINV